MKETIDKLVEEREKLLERVKKIDKAIDAFQEICEHDYEFDSNDSHKDYYKCNICRSQYSV